MVHTCSHTTRRQGLRQILGTWDHDDNTTVVIPLIRQRIWRQDHSVGILLYEKEKTVIQSSEYLTWESAATDQEGTQIQVCLTREPGLGAQDSKARGAGKANNSTRSTQTILLWDPECQVKVWELSKKVGAVVGLEPPWWGRNKQSSLQEEAN